MKLSNLQLAFETARAADAQDDPQRKAALRALAQTLCDRPHGLRFRYLAHKAARLPELPDDMWNAPLPNDKLATADLQDSIARLSENYGQSVTGDWIMLREVAWRANTLARLREAAIEKRIKDAVLGNGGHTAMLFHPQTYTRPDGVNTVPLDTAAGRSALLEDLERFFHNTDEGVPA